MQNMFEHSISNKKMIQQMLTCYFYRLPITFIIFGAKALLHFSICSFPNFSHSITSEILLISRIKINFLRIAPIPEISSMIPRIFFLNFFAIIGSIPGSRN